MTHHDPILVAVDGSRGSSAAIRFAAHEAQRLGTGIRLVHVTPNYVPMAPMLPLAPADLEDTGRQILQVAAQEACMLLAPERVTTSLLAGPRVSALAQAGQHARLVVLGSEHQSTVERVLTGSTLLGVASRASCPVVAVPEGWTPSEEHHTVTAGIKSTERSAELVRRTFEIAAERSARVVLVHAWELPNEYDDLISSRVDEDEWAERARRSIERSLDGLREAYPNVPLEIRVVHGQAARELQRASNDADLMLLARRPHAFPVGHIGGTGRALLRESHCPVEVVPPADEPSDTTDLVLEAAGALTPTRGAS
jgi:nucleotide-binding universal stress UspA family protein